jgi:probable addiction module antidote protein
MAKRDQKEVELKLVAARFNAALGSTDIDLICRAIGDAVMSHNVSDIARKSGLERPSLYRAFGDKQHPNFSTILGVLDAMGLRLKVMKSPKK